MTLYFDGTEIEQIKTYLSSKSSSELAGLLMQKAKSVKPQVDSIGQRFIKEAPTEIEDHQKLLALGDSAINEYFSILIDFALKS